MQLGERALKRLARCQHRLRNSLQPGVAAHQRKNAPRQLAAALAPVLADEVGPDPAPD